MILGLFGIPLILVVFGLQIYTAALLGKSWIIATNLDPLIFRKNRQDSNANNFYTKLINITFFYVRIYVFNYQQIGPPIQYLIYSQVSFSSSNRINAGSTSTNYCNFSFGSYNFWLWNTQFIGRQVNYIKKKKL